jgi:hypothetical protein
MQRLKLSFIWGKKRGARCIPQIRVVYFFDYSGSVKLSKLTPKNACDADPYMGEFSSAKRFKR